MPLSPVEMPQAKEQAKAELRASYTARLRADEELYQLAETASADLREFIQPAQRLILADWDSARSGVGDPLLVLRLTDKGEFPEGAVVPDPVTGVYRLDELHDPLRRKSLLALAWNKALQEREDAMWKAYPPRLQPPYPPDED